jgi:mRNA interferase RelE/StbE
LYGRVAQLNDPRSIGEALKGSKLGAFWKYRVGDYRIVTSIEDGTLRILVVRIGNRKEVYRK